MTTEEKIWNYLKGRGLTDAGTAGLMGNLYAESGLRPNNLQNNYEGNLGYADAEYTEAVDKGTYPNFDNDRAGYGIAQWTDPKRKANLHLFAKDEGKSIGDLSMQLDFLMQELQGSYRAVLNVLKTAATVREASDTVLLRFECPADRSVAVKKRRAGYGQVYYNKYAAKGAAEGGAKMNKQPVSYLQTDTRWKNEPYRVKGETSTIGSAGCGPTAAAMLISTLIGKTFTPKDACAWALAHGYKALNQGTYYAYFKPQFAEFGINCDMLNWVNTYNKPNSGNHQKALELLKQGYYLIALMGRGLWTKSGHFVVVWWADGKVHINDPASTNPVRLTGDLTLFKSQVKYYWWIDARKFNANGQTSVGAAPAAAAPAAIPERKATGTAKSYDKQLAGTYAVTAAKGLHVRNVAGAKTGSMIVLPHGTRVQNYGYYTLVDGVKWLYIQVTYQGVKYTGFSSGQYLRKQ